MHHVNSKDHTCFKDRGRPDKSSYFEIHIAVNYAKNTHVGVIMYEQFVLTGI